MVNLRTFTISDYIFSGFTVPVDLDECNNLEDIVGDSCLYQLECILGVYPCGIYQRGSVVHGSRSVVFLRIWFLFRARRLDFMNNRGVP